MFNAVTHVTVLVEDTDEALDWYTSTLGFEQRSDEEFAPGMRWVTVAPPADSTELVLQEPNPEFHGPDTAAELQRRIGQGTMTVLSVTDCRETVRTLEERGVTITTPPEEVPWGIHANIEDPYGNPYNLVENRGPPE